MLPLNPSKDYKHLVMTDFFFLTLPICLSLLKISVAVEITILYFYHASFLLSV